MTPVDDLPTAHRQRTPFVARWSLRRVEAGCSSTPDALREATDGDWLDIAAPGTVAAALRSVGQNPIDDAAPSLDAFDWWFRAVFDDASGAPPTTADTRRRWVFGGLAGVCEVWLNGAPLLRNDNMHVSRECTVPPLRRVGNELLMRFSSLDRWLAQKRQRPRPRWRAPMVAHQQLRWARTTLLGRTPGWSPPVPPIGPWRAIEWVDEVGIEVASLQIRSHVDKRCGVVALSARLLPVQGAAVIAEAVLELDRDGAVHRCALVRAEPGGTRFDATLTVPDATLWWPHTHGEPALYGARLVVRIAGRNAPVVVDIGRLGFRTIAVDTGCGDFALSVNGVPVFCRGACWMPLDAVSLSASREAVDAALVQARDAGMNMLRVSGSTVYETDAFFDGCDALGILVWQEFMFANMDYPGDEPAFAASVRAEAAAQLERWQRHPSLAVVCGNSEAEQQAAMWGAPRSQWSQPLFDTELAALTASLCGGAVYWPSSAHGGDFPHRNDMGTTSYYGVGAYLRPLDDARRSGLRFATECLAFANVPPPSTLARMPARGGPVRPFDATWKARAPRDLGAGWDFDDVRDHYLERLYRVDPIALRAADPERYLAMSRAVGAEVMLAAFAEWRRAASGCRGALVWFLRDLWAGAGWGLLDELGVPKAAFHGCRRGMAPIALFITDEGTNGLDLHLVNDPAHALEAQVHVALYRDDGLVIEEASQHQRVAPHGAVTLPLAAWFDRFIDLSRAYRFGPAEHAVVVATLRDSSGLQLAQAFHFAGGLPSTRTRDIGLTARVESDNRRGFDGGIELVLRTRGFAQSVYLEVPGFVADDEYFHLAPGSERRIRLKPIAGEPRGTARGRGQAHALNASTPARWELLPC